MHLRMSYIVYMWCICFTFRLLDLSSLACPDVRSWLRWSVVGLGPSNVSMRCRIYMFVHTYIDLHYNRPGAAMIYPDVESRSIRLRPEINDTLYMFVQRLRYTCHDLRPLWFAGFFEFVIYEVFLPVHR